jgi:pimeloyl-ACP methyl ester carboxylesterase
MSLIYGMNYEYKNNQSDSVLVFLHGWGCNKKYWENIISALGNRYSYIRMDLYGFGESEMPKNYFDTYEYAYKVFVVLKELGIDKITLVGHSFGGRLSILLSSVFDLNVENVVLTAAAGLNRFSLLKLLRVWHYKLCKRMVRFKVFPKCFLNKFGSKDYKGANANLRGVLSRVVVQDLSFCLSRVCSPVVLFWGRCDKDTPYWLCKKIQKNIKTPVRLYLNKNSGHFVAFKNYMQFAKVLLDLSN